MKTVIVVSLIIFAFACYSVLPNTVDIKQRGVICNTQKYNTQTVTKDIQLCRLGLTKETQKGA